MHIIVQFPSSDGLFPPPKGGNSFSYTNEAGIWTWSAEEDYVWHWDAHIPDYSVTSLKRAEQSVADHGSAPAPVMRPDSTPEARRAISWQFVIGLTTGVVVVGSVIYFFIRRRRRALKSPPAP